MNSRAPACLHCGWKARNVRGGACRRCRARARRAVRATAHRRREYIPVPRRWARLTRAAGSPASVAYGLTAAHSRRSTTEGKDIMYPNSTAKTMAREAGRRAARTTTGTPRARAAAAREAERLFLDGRAPERRRFAEDAVRDGRSHWSAELVALVGRIEREHQGAEEARVDQLVADAEAANRAVATVPALLSWHEAGHAVCAWDLGFPLAGVQVFNRHAAEMQYWARRDDHSDHARAAACVVALAGGLAERMSPLWEDRFECHTGALDDAARIFDILGWDDDVFDTITALAERAESVLCRHFDRLTALANALDSRQILGPAAVRKILDAPAPAPLRPSSAPPWAPPAGGSSRGPSFAEVAAAAGRVEQRAGARW